MTYIDDDYHIEDYDNDYDDGEIERGENYRIEQCESCYDQFDNYDDRPYDLCDYCLENNGYAKCVVCGEWVVDKRSYNDVYCKCDNCLGKN